MAEVQLGQRRAPEYAGDTEYQYIRAANIKWRGLDLSDVKSMGVADEPNALKAFVADTATSEEEGLRLIAQLFERPAFQTPFRQESSIPAFHQALANTIEALNTGLWRARDGTCIGRVPSKNDFTSPKIRAALNKAVTRIVELRAAYEDAARLKRVVPCGC